jgi:propionyl-CoA synthetase
VPIIDNYWQTETGWPILSIAKGIEDADTAGQPRRGHVRLQGQAAERVHRRGMRRQRKRRGDDRRPAAAGLHADRVRRRQRFVDTYWSESMARCYSTFDWGMRDADGYYFILGRTDDVINVAGHRLGTREIEESITSHPNVSEVAVVGVEDKLKGQVAVAFAILKDAPQPSEQDVMAVVDRQLGAVARPARVYFVTQLPKTRSGKLLRRSIQAICEGRSPATSRRLKIRHRYSRSTRVAV